MISYTNEIRLNDGQIYSLDMIRLSLEFREDVQGFVTWLSNKNITEDNFDVKHKLCLSEFQYRDFFNIITDRYSFVLGIGFNGATADRNKGFIEFNPNKCKGAMFDKVFNKLRDYLISMNVVRYDLAIDIPVTRYLTRLVKDNRTYWYLCGRLSETEYLGTRNKPGFVKLYDKKKESGLDYELTRLEITCELSTAFENTKGITDISKINFPEVIVLYEQEGLVFDELSSTDKVLVQLLKTVDNPNAYLRQLKYEKRKKIEPYLCERTIQLNMAACAEIVKQVRNYQM